MEKKTDASNTFLGLLGLLFIALKLTGIIDWSWWLVTLPLYIGLLILIVIILGYAVIKSFMK